MGKSYARSTHASSNHSSLKFDASRHCIVNLISTLPNGQLIDMINNNDLYGDTVMTRNQVVKAVPLPGVQFLSGKLTLILLKCLTNNIDYFTQ